MRWLAEQVKRLFACSVSGGVKNRLKIIDPEFGLEHPSVQPISADLKAGRVAADCAPVATKFQSQITTNGK